jgi:hypothetical protein
MESMMKDWVLGLVVVLSSLGCNRSPESAPQGVSGKAPVAAKVDAAKPAEEPLAVRRAQEKCVEICERGMRVSEQQDDHVYACEAECKADPQAYKKGYAECLENCGSVMDDHGQVRDECPNECKKDPQAYTEDDVPSDDESAGLVVKEQCLSDCLGKKVDASSVAQCKQSCCVGHCQGKAEYSGSGMGAECPMACREFLKRSAKK